MDYCYWAVLIGLSLHLVQLLWKGASLGNLVHWVKCFWFHGQHPCWKRIWIAWRVGYSSKINCTWEKLLFIFQGSCTSRVLFLRLYITSERLRAILYLRCKQDVVKVSPMSFPQIFLTFTWAAFVRLPVMWFLHLHLSSCLLPADSLISRICVMCLEPPSSQPNSCWPDNLTWVWPPYHSQSAGDVIMNIHDARTPSISYRPYTHLLSRSDC